jgi:hypothetical protein
MRHSIVFLSAFLAVTTLTPLVPALISKAEAGADLALCETGVGVALDKDVGKERSGATDSHADTYTTG